MRSTELHFFLKGDDVPKWVESFDPPENKKHCRFGKDVYVIRAWDGVFVLPSGSEGTEGASIEMDFENGTIVRGAPTSIYGPGVRTGRYPIVQS